MLLQTYPSTNGSFCFHEAKRICLPYNYKVHAHFRNIFVVSFSSTTFRFSWSLVGYRSVERDLEVQLAIATDCQSLRQDLAKVCPGSYSGGRKLNSLCCFDFFWSWNFLCLWPTLHLSLFPNLSHSPPPLSPLPPPSYLSLFSVLFLFGWLYCPFWLLTLNRKQTISLSPPIQSANQPSRRTTTVFPQRYGFSRTLSKDTYDIKYPDPTSLGTDPSSAHWQFYIGIKFRRIQKATMYLFYFLAIDLFQNYSDADRFHSGFIRI